MSDTYLELPREINDARELGIILTIIGFIFMLYFIVTAVTYVKLSELDLMSVVIGTIAIPCMAGLLYYNWRVHIEAPADLPIRFNRMRRKVYAYNFHSNSFRFWSRKGWGVTPVVYDWDNLRAEFYSAYGPMGDRGLGGKHLSGCCRAKHRKNHRSLPFCAWGISRQNVMGLGLLVYAARSKCPAGLWQCLE